MTKHIAIYARVSTRKQDTKSQEPDLERWISAYADGQEVRWYRDKATGKTMARSGWQRLQGAIERGEVSRVVCWRIDRLGRLCSGLATLFDDLRRRKIDLVSLKDGLSLSTPAGRMVANILASIAQFETELRGERVAAGQAAARERGVRWGGSEKGRLLYVSQEQVDTVRRLNAEGKGKTAIARATGLSRPTVYRLLNRTG